MSLSVDLLLAFSLFAFVTSVTPGPNNTMLLASGVNFGFVRSIPHILGISCGFFIMVMAVGFGLGTVFEAYPVLYTILRYVGAAYLLYLAGGGVLRAGHLRRGPRELTLEQELAQVRGAGVLPATTEVR